MDIKKLLAEATPMERSIPVCLDGKLVAEIQEAERELAAAQRQPEVGTSLAGSPAMAVARRIRDLEERAQAKTVPFRLVAIPRPAFTALVTAHPPRPGNAGDDRLGFNEPAVDRAMVRASLVEPQLDEDDWLRLLGPEDDDQVPGEGEDRPRRGVLSSGQYEQLVNAAWSVNRRDVDVPFSHAASEILRTSSPE